jgi:hypothetical protein
MTTDDTVLAGLQHASLLQGDCETSSVTSHAITPQLVPESAVVLDMR